MDSTKVTAARAAIEKAAGQPAADDEDLSEFCKGMYAFAKEAGIPEEQHDEFVANATAVLAKEGTVTREPAAKAPAGKDARFAVLEEKLAKKGEELSAKDKAFVDGIRAFAKESGVPDERHDKLVELTVKASAKQEAAAKA